LLALSVTLLGIGLWGIGAPGYTREEAGAAARERFRRVVNRSLDDLDGAKLGAILARLHTMSERSEAIPPG
jgi:hypothetical protein